MYVVRFLSSSSSSQLRWMIFHSVWRFFFQSHNTQRETVLYCMWWYAMWWCCYCSSNETTFNLFIATACMHVVYPPPFPWFGGSIITFLCMYCYQHFTRSVARRLFWHAQFLCNKIRYANKHKSRSGVGMCASKRYYVHVHFTAATALNKMIVDFVLWFWVQSIGRVGTMCVCAQSSGGCTLLLCTIMVGITSVHISFLLLVVFICFFSSTSRFVCAKK